ncbi:uncharacterized protein LOC133285092 isoform X2 [Gastrolobium bilobum]|uniref:uncharacterized protein LOC133285092 isoform X2 n=1 Tax=Gastrolobium bilobum TaxID=150636 RepID=UPI002AAF6C23|nr:uncharacterized protein LOC133285092 isoform X2 [Gastrolobium bilobum]
MAFTSCSLASQFLPLRKVSLINPFHSTNFSTVPFPAVPTRITQPLFSPSISTCLSVSASKNNEQPASSSSSSKEKEEIEVEVEVEEELPWIQEKALDLVEYTGSVTQAIPGPRVGPTSLPWILAIPLAYAGITFVIAFVRTVTKFTSPKAKRRRLVGKNATLCKSLDDLFQKGRNEVTLDALKEIENKIRKASMLDDSQVAEVLNEISRRIMRDKGPIVMDKSGYTEKGFKRKLAVQALFGKIFYLSELPEFCSRDSSLVVKEIFGVTDEDADKLRLHTVSEAGNLDALEKMVDGSDSEDSGEVSSDTS